MGGLLLPGSWPWDCPCPLLLPGGWESGKPQVSQRLHRTGAACPAGPGRPSCPCPLRPRTLLPGGRPRWSCPSRPLEARLPGAQLRSHLATAQTPAKQGSPALAEREGTTEGQAHPTTSGRGGQGLLTGPGRLEEARLVPGRGWARPLPLRPPLVRSASSSTYLTESHTIFLFYYHQGQGQPLLSNKRNALNGLLYS